MGGKASMLVVLGFSAIMLVVGFNFNNVMINAVDNFADYYDDTIAHNIAVSGANMAANRLFITGALDEDAFEDLVFENGLINASITDFGTDQKKLVATGTYQGITSTVEIILKPSSFAKFAYYMNLFGGSDELTTGDTIWGPFHTNGKLTTTGSPVFYGKATAKLGLKMNNPKDPKFYGGFESGVEIPFEIDATVTENAAIAGGFYEPSGTPVDYKFVFNSDATITYSSRATGTVAWGPDTTAALSTFAPNGVVWINKGNMYVSGTVNGKYTFGIGQSSGVGNGNVYIQDDLVYRTDPIDDPDCEDMLGIVTGNNVIIEDTPANHSDCNIHATMINTKGGMSVENLNSFPAAGDLYIAGGVIGYQTGSVSIYSGTTLEHGYKLKLKYDERFLLENPPAFPATANFEIVSWWE
ncbi:MAG: DUF4900 domain-containing protein [Melioribacteraceae bacterium]|nr:DUF4900 domain-containing protein [Melioribacteraceae bacterium]MCF8353871.1 DUF4900 domain-containing protein [Melioribacteraceae bacterium]MCF8393104.1 DUF4900 domain-containing protein [Melioribacteraceae bacterium]MCF8419223.1 DUF4900 domain-containing protein [Melioribacteraceae bacterium]